VGDTKQGKVFVRTMGLGACAGVAALSLSAAGHATAGFFCCATENPVAARAGRRKLLAQAAGAQQQEEAKKAAQLHKGKKIKVVSIAGALFDVSDDGQYLVRRIKCMYEGYSSSELLVSCHVAQYAELLNVIVCM
jgi:hypothetical protein